MADTSIDPPGTCHLVGCPDKGKHPPHEINNWLTYLAKLGAELEDKASRTAEWLQDMTQPIADKVISKIGAGEWSDYDHCLGTPIFEAGLGGITARCSLDGGWHRAGIISMTSAAAAAFVDNHKVHCPNRKATPNG